MQELRNLCPDRINLVKTFVKPKILQELIDNMSNVEELRLSPDETQLEFKYNQQSFTIIFD